MNLNTQAVPQWHIRLSLFLPCGRPTPESDARTQAPATCPSARCMNRPFSARFVSLPVSLPPHGPLRFARPPERRSARPLAHHDPPSPVLRNFVPSSRGKGRLLRGLHCARHGSVRAAADGGGAHGRAARAHGPTRARLLCRTMERMGQISPLPLPPPRRRRRRPMQIRRTAFPRSNLGRMKRQRRE